MRKLVLVCAAMTLIGAQFPALGQEPRDLKMTTVVSDFVTRSWTIECPDGEILDMSEVALTDAGIIAVTALISSIESSAGFRIKSKTRVVGRVTQEDTIRSVTKMTASEVQSIKDLIAIHRIPEMPVFIGRARIQTVVVDGVVESQWIDLGDGRIVDLSGAGLSPQQQQAMNAAIMQLEQNNGVHIAGQTSVADGATNDSILAITLLTGQDVANFRQFSQAQGILLPMDLAVFDVSTKLAVTIDGQSDRLRFEGTALLQIPPDPFAGATVPIQIVELSLQSVEPTIFGAPVEVGLTAPGSGQLFPRGTKNDRVDLQLDLPLQVSMPGLDLNAECPVLLTGPAQLPVLRDSIVRGVGQTALLDAMTNDERGAVRVQGALRVHLPAQVAFQPPP